MTDIVSDLIITRLKEGENRVMRIAMDEKKLKPSLSIKSNSEYDIYTIMLNAVGLEGLIRRIDEKEKLDGKV